MNANNKFRPNLKKQINFSTLDLFFSPGYHMSTQFFSTAYHCSNRISNDMPSGITFLRVLESDPRVYRYICHDVLADIVQIKLFLVYISLQTCGLEIRFLTSAMTTKR